MRVKYSLSRFRGHAAIVQDRLNQRRAKYVRKPVVLPPGVSIADSIGLGLTPRRPLV